MLSTCCRAERERNRYDDDPGLVRVSSSARLTGTGLCARARPSGRWLASIRRSRLSRRQVRPVVGHARPQPPTSTPAACIGGTPRLVLTMSHPLPPTPYGLLAIDRRARPAETIGDAFRSDLQTAGAARSAQRPTLRRREGYSVDGRLGLCRTAHTVDTAPRRDRARSSTCASRDDTTGALPCPAASSWLET